MSSIDRLMPPSAKNHKNFNLARTPSNTKPKPKKTSTPCCGKSKKVKKKSSSSSSGKPIPLNEYEEIHTEPFLQLRRKKPKSSSSEKKKITKKKKSKKRYQPKKSNWLKAALLASLMSPVNQDVNVQPGIDPVLGPIDPSERLIRRKQELRMDNKNMIPIQENQQILEDDAFAEVLNEYRNNPRATPKNRQDPNRPTYKETRDRLQKKRMEKQQQRNNTKHRGRKKKHTKKKKKQ